MKITNLIEDTAGECNYLYGHGLSFYIETEHHKVLLDTGADDAFIKNAKSKGVDLKTVDTLIISHGHYDHAGGVLAFAALNPYAKIYIRKSAFGEFYSLKSTGPKYIGINCAIASLPQTIFIDGDATLDSELSVFGGVCGTRLLPRGNAVLKEKCGNDFLQDSFEHEQYLVVRENGKSVLLSGCAHKGILNILDAYRMRYGGSPDIVVSGFHTTKSEYDSEDDALIQQTALELASTDTLYFTGHCTGEHAMEIFKHIMGEKLRVLHSGSEIL